MIKGKEFPQPLTKVKNWLNRKINLHVAYYSIHTANVVQLADRLENKGRVWRLSDTETCRQCGALVGELYPRHEKQTKESGRNDRKQI